MSKTTYEIAEETYYQAPDFYAQHNLTISDINDIAKSILKIMVEHGVEVD